MIEGTIQNQSMIINAVCAASAFWGREEWYTGTDSIPEEVLDKIARTPGFGRWVMRFALYGDAPIVAHNRAKIERALTSIPGGSRSEEHTSELQSLMRISYAVFCLKKKKTRT